MDFSFLHAADLHLGSPMRGLEATDDGMAEFIRTASSRAMENLVREAIERRVDFVLLSGDLYDVGWRDYRIGLSLVGQLAELERKNIRVFAISGNHDAERVMKKQLRLPGVMFAADKPGRQVLGELGVAITGQSYAERATTANLAAGYPEPEQAMFNIAMLHTACGRGGHENYAPCTPDELVARGYDYWALGHVHAWEIVREDPWIVFPGVLQGRHVNEPGANGAVLVRVQGGRVAAVERLALDVLRWGRAAVDLTGAACLDEALDRVQAAVAALDGEVPMAVRFRLHGACAAHASLVANGADLRGQVSGAVLEVVPDGQVWVEQVELDTSPAEDMAALQAEAGVVGDLVRALDAADGLHEAGAAFVRGLLAKPGLVAALTPGSAAAAVLGGTVPPALLRRARDLVLGSLRAG